MEKTFFDVSSNTLVPTVTTYFLYFLSENNVYVVETELNILHFLLIPIELVISKIFLELSNMFAEFNTTFRSQGMWKDTD